MSDPTNAQEEEQMAMALDGQIEEHLQQRLDPWHEQQELPPINLAEVRWMGSWDEWLPVYNQLPVVTRSTLAHLHGRHSELTMHCLLCVESGVVGT